MKRFGFALLKMVLVLMLLAGCSGGGGSSSTTSGDTSAPTTPTGLLATAVTSTQISLSWTASTDNTAVTGYKIYQSGSLLATATVVSYLHSGLTASTQYCYNVSAVDAANNESAQSGQVCATTNATTSGATGTSIKLPKTGQTTCYDSAGTVISCATTTAAGQDGALQKGVAWPDPRFTTNADTAVTDNLTGLVWAPNGNVMPTRDNGWDADGMANDGRVTWQHALDYVAKLNTGNYLGHNDWRLPNRKELRSLVNYGQSNTAVWLNAQGFSNTQANGYWSSTSCMFDTTSAWAVDMYDGGWNFNIDVKAGNYFVWPVRAGQGGAPADQERTGQTTCYDSAGIEISCVNTGQDGNLQKGVAWPEPRFIDNGNSTVTDNLTGLIWTKDGNAPGPSICSLGTEKTWQDALAYIACLNTNSYLGFTDWRLPNVKELESLVNANQSKTATWLNTQNFTNVQANDYWSSTSYIGTGTASSAWHVGMWGGAVYASYKSFPWQVWPVRSKQ